MMQDTLLQVITEYPTTQSIRVETPIGTIETGDDNPVLDYLVVSLVFMGFCIWIYVRFFRILKK